VAARDPVRVLTGGIGGCRAPRRRFTRRRLASLADRPPNALGRRGQLDVANSGEGASSMNASATTLGEAAVPPSLPGLMPSGLLGSGPSVNSHNNSGQYPFNSMRRKQGQ